MPTCISWFLSSEGQGCFQNCLPTGDRPLLISVLLSALSLPLVRNKLALVETLAGSTGRYGVVPPELKGYLVLFPHYACTVYGAHVVTTDMQSSLIFRARCII